MLLENLPVAEQIRGMIPPQSGSRFNLFPEVDLVEDEKCWNGINTELHADGKATLSFNPAALTHLSRTELINIMYAKTGELHEQFQTQRVKNSFEKQLKDAGDYDRQINCHYIPSTYRAETVQITDLRDRLNRIKINFDLNKVDELSDASLDATMEHERGHLHQQKANAKQDSNFMAGQNHKIPAIIAGGLGGLLGLALATNKVPEQYHSFVAGGLAATSLLAASSTIHQTAAEMIHRDSEFDADATATKTHGKEVGIQYQIDWQNVKLATNEEPTTLEDLDLSGYSRFTKMLKDIKVGATHPALERRIYNMMITNTERE